MVERISIGGKNGDQELIQKIVKFQKDNHYSTPTEALRELVKDALKFKELLK